MVAVELPCASRQNPIETPGNNLLWVSETNSSPPLVAALRGQLN